jgi:predicted AAA+ superfamily ATPase
MAEIRRQAFDILSENLGMRPQFINLVAGPRQVGKSTMVRQVLRQEKYCDSFLSVSADPASEVESAEIFVGLNSASGVSRDAKWLVGCWEEARRLQRERKKNFILAIDEIQKISNWANIVKGLWDSDRAADLDLHVVILGSSPLLIQSGLTESLAGRYELLRLSHWSFLEMREAFDVGLEEYCYFGGYPKAVELLRGRPDEYEKRWREYVLGSLIEPSVRRDILEINRIDKPALLEQLFFLCCELSSKIVSYTNLMGPLQDAGNTTTIAKYLDLLRSAGFIAGLAKHSGRALTKRNSSPKINVLNTALMSAVSDYNFAQAKADRTFWGQLVESSVGAHLCNSVDSNQMIRYWREGNEEVDFVVASRGGKLTAIEVKSGSKGSFRRGMFAFEKRFGRCKKLQVGGDGIPLEEFLSYPASHWVE